MSEVDRDPFVSLPLPSDTLSARSLSWRQSALLYIKSQETKSGKGNQNSFMQVFPRSDFGKAKISYNFFAEESRPLLS